MARSTAGEYIPDDLPQYYTYNGDQTVNYVEQTYLTKTWRMTYTYVGGLLDHTSGWVEQ